MGGKTVIEQPAAPAAPSVSSSIQDYISNYPALFNLMQQYGPQEAQMQVDLASQYAAPLGTALKTAQEAMYPMETDLTKLLNEQVQQGMTSGLPSKMREQYRSDVAGQLGTNVGSPIGAFETADRLMQADQNYQEYMRNLGLSIVGKQPIFGAQNPQYTNQLQNYTPQGVMNYNASNYGNYAGLYGNMYGTNAQMAQSNANTPFKWMSGIGNMMGGIGSMASGGLFKLNNNW